MTVKMPFFISPAYSVPRMTNSCSSKLMSTLVVDVMPVVLEQTTDAGDGLVRDWALPDVGGDKHRVYMMQWYAFAALAFGLWAFFTFRALRARWQA